MTDEEQKKAIMRRVYYLRLCVERKAMDKRISELASLIDTDTFKSFDDIDQAWVSQKLSIEKKYLAMIDEHIALVRDAMENVESVESVEELFRDAESE